MRIAAIADIHCNTTSHDLVRSLFAQMAQRADIVLLCGDLVDYGLPEEAAVLAKEISSLKIPTLAVLGNHEYESGKEDEVRRILTGAGATILDGDAREIMGVGFAGVKGFGGGFGACALRPWGEQMTKQFVHEAVSEALKLECALHGYAPTNESCSCTTLPFRQLLSGSRRRFFLSWAPAGLKSRSIAIPSQRCFMGTLIGALPRGARRAMCRCTTSR